MLAPASISAWLRLTDQRRASPADKPLLLQVALPVQSAEFGYEYNANMWWPELA